MSFRLLSCTGSRANTIGKANPIRYRGYVYDEETGLYYLGSRYYNPEVGRFINADAVLPLLSIHTNLFSYCCNDSVNMKDAEGQYPVFLGSENDDLLSSELRHIDTRPVPFCTCDFFPYDVYFVSGEQYEKYKNTKGIDEIWIVDERRNSNPTMRVMDSYRIKDTNLMLDIITVMLRYNEMFPSNPGWKRSPGSMIDEWKRHNFAYESFCIIDKMRSPNTTQSSFIANGLISAQHCDFDNKDEGKTFFTFVFDHLGF